MRDNLFVDCNRYADRANAYWTGYFTSRPTLKGYIRMLSGYYMVRHYFIFLWGMANRLGPARP